MEKLKTCSNGHNYDAGKFPVCPYCPGGVLSSDYEKTMSDFRKTKLDEMNDIQFDKTIINEENMERKVNVSGNDVTVHPFSRTTIVTKDGSNQEKPLEQSEKRKLVGWLVSFTYDEYGEDFKIFQGKNKIGSNVGDIMINDTSVSGEHAIILFRNNEFLIKDSFSTNGTKVNGISVEESKLKDGDELLLGKTLLKFKTVF